MPIPSLLYAYTMSESLSTLCLYHDDTIILGAESTDQRQTTFGQQVSWLLSPCSAGSDITHL